MMKNISKFLNSCYPQKSYAIFYDEDTNDLELQPRFVAEIFKLDLYCFDEIFEYLSLKDLYSFGQSCRAMQRVAGEYFKQNYELSEKFSDNNGIYTLYSDHEGVINQRIQTSNFRQFIKCISHYYEDLEPLHYIRKHSKEFNSINAIDFVCLTIDSTKVKYLRKVLPKIEVMKVNQCALKGDFYKTLLKYCENLKQLYVQQDLGYIITKNATWMNRSYPHLEHLHLTPQYPFKIHGLYTFFQQNPNIRCFSTSSRCLWECRNQILASRAQLNRLDIHISDHYYFSLIDMQLICCLLNKLYEQNFYKELHLYTKRIDQQFCDQLFSVCGLDRLSIKMLRECFSLPRMINLKELLLYGHISKTNIDILSQSLWNLELLSICNVTSDDILPFMRHSIKLYKIYAQINNGTLDLHKLNKERKTLNGACKVTIYVPTNIFLATKWTTKNGVIDLCLVEMKRAESV